MNRLAELVDAIDMYLADKLGDARQMLQHLIEHEGATLVISQTKGECRLRLAGVVATCANGHHGLLINWRGLAQRRIEGAAA
jgi:hypothetical protein